MIDDTTTSAPLRGPVPLSHLLLQRFVHRGGHVVDATCGNGHDTLLLAELVGADGRVWAFDIQQQALDITGRLLAGKQLTERVILLHTGHEELAAHVSAPLQAVVFNLGYLPGGERSIITTPATTCKSLEQALALLSPGGVILITVYPGHAGGPSEQNAVEAWAAALSSRVAHCWRMGQLNVSTTAPYLLLVQKVS